MPKKIDNGGLTPPADKKTQKSLTVEQQNNQLINNPSLPQGAVFTPAQQEVKNNELINKNTLNAGSLNRGAATAQEVDPTNAAQADASLIGDNAAQGDAAQGQLSDGSVVDAAQGTASDDFNQAIADAQNQQVEFDPRALVQNQYANLMDFEAGDIPPWAAGAVSQAQGIISARGLSGSTIQLSAITASLMQAAMPIASQDAKVFEGIMLTEFDTRQAAALMKAGHLAELDMANLNNRQQSNVLNAQSFLQMDLTNLSNSQQMAILNVQSRMQAMLSDQASENATSQFNASSQQQNDQFFANLTSSMRTFNASQKQDQRQFNQTLTDQRQQFNKNMGFLIDQSNAEWFRQVSTANTASINEANFVNSQNVYEMSSTAMANAVQLLRDREHYAHEMYENEQERILSRWLQTTSIGAAKDQANKELWADLGGAVGGAIVGGIINRT